MSDLTALMGHIKAAKNGFTDEEMESLSDLDLRSLREVLPLWNEIPTDKQEQFLDELLTFYESETRVSYENLGQVLMSDKSPSIRVRGLMLLGENESGKVANKVIAMANDDPDETVRAEALEQLGRYVSIYTMDKLEGLNAEEAHRTLITAAHDRSAKIARAGLRSLAFFDRPECAPLIEAAFAHKDARWQESAVIAAGRVSDPQWLGNILNALESPDRDVRMSAAGVIGGNNIKNAREKLLSLLDEEEDTEVFNALIWALSCIGGEDVRTMFEAVMAECEDDGQLDFLEEALENLSLTEEMDQFDFFKFDGADEEDLEIREFDTDNELDTLPNLPPKKKK